MPDNDKPVETGSKTLDDYLANLEAIAREKKAKVRFIV